MKVNVWKISTIVLAGALATVLGSSRMNEANAEKQPHMASALNFLEKAHAALSSATADKGGHRVKAMQLTNDAIAEVKKGIEFDNKH